MKQLQWYAVRCCCTPHVILGFMTAPAGHEGQYLNVVRLDASLYVKPASESLLDNFLKNAEVEFAMFDRGDGTKELAIKSNDRPLEWWRNIVGFVEVVREELSPYFHEAVKEHHIG